MESSPTDIHNLDIRAAGAEIVTWQGRETLRLEDGLALVPAGRIEDACIEVLIGTDGLAYPGVAFRVADVRNYELAYAVPHVSGQWDALQYDPVFHGSNTWQLYHGPGYQGATQVPMGCWFQFKVSFSGTRAVISVDGQSPLVVDKLAHTVGAGRFGLWTFRPAYFRDLRISACEGPQAGGGETTRAAEDIVEAWFVEGYGVVTCEPNGAINLNRYLPMSVEEVHLVRRFEAPQAGAVTLDFGFSDLLTLELDGETVFSGENTFKGFADRAARGYAELGTHSVQRVLPAGPHCLAAKLRTNEGFGWGLVMAVQGERLKWLPVELG